MRDDSAIEMQVGEGMLNNICAKGTRKCYLMSHGGGSWGKLKECESVQCTMSCSCVLACWFLMFLCLTWDLVDSISVSL